MATVRLYATDCVFTRKNNFDFRDTTSLTARIEYNSETDATALFCHFDAMPAAYEYKLISNANDHRVGVYVSSLELGYRNFIFLYALKNSFDIYTTDIAQLWNIGHYTVISILNDEDGQIPGYLTRPLSTSSPASFNRDIVQLLNYGGAIDVGAGSSYYARPSAAIIQTANASNKPYIDVEVTDTSYHITANTLTPANGYIDETKAKQFTWTYTDNGYAAAMAKFVNNSTFTFEWRVGSSGTTHSITGTKSGVTVPANTFPTTGEVQARLKIVDALGYTTYTAWNSYTTTDSPSTATALEPISTIKSDAEPITFRWQHSISTGTAQTAAELQWSSNLTEWNALASESGNANSKTIDLSGLPGGSIYWRVRTANSDGVFSAWSSPVSFIFVAAPPAPIVAVNPVPMSVISWQAQNQQAYEVELDGVSQGIKFGNASSFTVREPLSDGTHTVSVRVQGAFSLWSTAAAVTFNVVNSPGVPITITVNSGIDAFIVWETEATDAVFYVYRDNKLIGKTLDMMFTDRLTAGSHDYSVIAAFPSGYYSKSNTVEAESGSDSVMIADIEGGSWIDISRSPDSNSSQDFSWTLTNSIRHFAGAKLPVIEMSEFEDETATYRTSISSTDDAKAFENLKGKICIVKSRRREVVIAALVRLKKSVENFFITYDFSMQRIHWEEITDETSS